MGITRYIELGAAAPALVAVGLIGVGAVRRWCSWRALRTGKGSLCPGRGWRAWEWVKPWSWVIRRSCGYDLSGIPRDERGGCICPECGRAVAASVRLQAVTARWRLVPLACLSLLMAAGMWRVRWIRQGGWIRYTPSTVLVLLERAAPAVVHTQRRYELEARLQRGGLWEWQKRQLVLAAVHELGDDGVDWNAGWAMGICRMVGDPAIPALEAALASPDRQRRQFAAGLLRDRADPKPERWWGWRNGSAVGRYRPTDELLAVTVEGLGDDEFPRGRKHVTWVMNAQDGFGFLQRYPDRTGPFLRAGLVGSDAQQRTLCAGLVGVCGMRELADLAGPILVEQLRDDGIEENGKLGIVALRSMGWPAIKHLQPAWDSEDAQQRILARQLLLAIVANETHTDDVERRCELMAAEPPITVMSRHPVAKLTLQHLDVLR